MKEIKIRYTFKRIYDGKIWQEIVPIECLEGLGDKPFVLRYKDGLGMEPPVWDIVGRDLFIGIQDSKGNEIYGNDILSGWKKGSNSDRGYTGYVFWQQEQAGWMIKCGKYNMEILSLAMSGWAGGDHNIIQIDSFEIIGNTYENADLIPPLTGTTSANESNSVSKS
jgi:hypothetical protein